jgi:hypothetical protein
MQSRAKEKFKKIINFLRLFIVALKLKKEINSLFVNKDVSLQFLFCLSFGIYLYLKFLNFI